MRDLKKYKGIFPAFYACYDEKGEVDLKGVRALTRYFKKQGVQGLYVNGSSGECIYLSVSERKAILEAVMEEAGHLAIIAHVACNNTRDSQELAAHAKALGVDAIAAIPPIYFKLPEHSIAKYWNDISQSARGVDFILYNIPQLAGVALTKNLFLTMQENEDVAGVKNSSMAAMDIQIFKNTGRPCVVFNGPDEQLVSGLAIGADGGIGGTYGVMPRLYVKLFELVEQGEYEKARQIQNVVNEIIFTLCSGRGNMYALIKEVLRLEENLDIGGVRLPLTDVTESDRDIAGKVQELIRIAKETFL